MYLGSTCFDTAYRRGQHSGNVLGRGHRQRDSSRFPHAFREVSKLETGLGRD